MSIDNRRAQPHISDIITKFTLGQCVETINTRKRNVQHSTSIQYKIMLILKNTNRCINVLLNIQLVYKKNCYKHDYTQVHRYSSACMHGCIHLTCMHTCINGCVHKHLYITYAHTCVCIYRTCMHTYAYSTCKYA